MARRFVMLCAAAAAVVVAGLQLGAAVQAAADDTAGIEFVQPPTAKPAKRVGGVANRCSEDPNLYVSILAPADTLGTTAAERPALYWYASKATKDPVEIAITDLRNKSKPVLELTLPGVAKPGVQRLDLAAHDAARLAPGGEYEWVIEVLTRDDAGSRNASAVARIGRVKDGGVPAPPAGANLPARAAFYAKHGVWFDYVAALLDAVRADPADRSLLARLGPSLKREKLIWKADGNVDELAATVAGER